MSERKHHTHKKVEKKETPPSPVEATFALSRQKFTEKTQQLGDQISSIMNQYPTINWEQQKASLNALQREGESTTERATTFIQTPTESPSLISQPMQEPQAEEQNREELLSTSSIAEAEKKAQEEASSILTELQSFIESDRIAGAYERGEMTPELVQFILAAYQSPTEFNFDAAIAAYPSFAIDFKYIQDLRNKEALAVLEVQRFHDMHERFVLQDQVADILASFNSDAFHSYLANRGYDEPVSSQVRETYQTVNSIAFQLLKGIYSTEEARKAGEIINTARKLFERMHLLQSPQEPEVTHESNVRNRLIHNLREIPAAMETTFHLLSVFKGLNSYEIAATHDVNMIFRNSPIEAFELVHSLEQQDPQNTRLINPRLLAVMDAHLEKSIINLKKQGLYPENSSEEAAYLVKRQITGDKLKKALPIVIEKPTLSFWQKVLSHEYIDQYYIQDAIIDIVPDSFFIDLDSIHVLEKGGYKANTELFEKIGGTAGIYDPISRKIKTYLVQVPSVREDLRDITGKKGDEAREEYRRVILHELGHHAHAKIFTIAELAAMTRGYAKDNHRNNFWIDARTTNIEDLNLRGDYTSSVDREAVANGFVLFFNHPTLFKHISPHFYQAMENAVVHHVPEQEQETWITHWHTHIASVEDAWRKTGTTVEAVREDYFRSHGEARKKTRQAMGSINQAA